MKCEYCDNEISGGTVSCPFCGAAMPAKMRESSDSVLLGNFQNAEQLRRLQREEELKKEKELLRQEQELEQERAKLKQLKLVEEKITEKSPANRIVFVILGLVFGFAGLQFLYAGRFFSFLIVFFGCFISIIIAVVNDWPFLGFVSFVLFLFSLVATFTMSADGRKRKMSWLK